MYKNTTIIYIHILIEYVGIDDDNNDSPGLATQSESNTADRHDFSRLNFQDIFSDDNNSNNTQRISTIQSDEEITDNNLDITLNDVPPSILNFESTSSTSTAKTISSRRNTVDKRSTSNTNKKRQPAELVDGNELFKENLIKQQQTHLLHNEVLEMQKKKIKIAIEQSEIELQKAKLELVTAREQKEIAL